MLQSCSGRAFCFRVGRGFAIWGPFPVHAPVKAPESCTSLNKNLALHPALTVVDGWGGFAGFGGFDFTHGHFGFHKKRAASVCMILAISLEARPRAGAIKAIQATQATNRPVKIGFVCMLNFALFRPKSQCACD